MRALATSTIMLLPEVDLRLHNATVGLYFAIRMSAWIMCQTQRTCTTHTHDTRSYTAPTFSSPSIVHALPRHRLHTTLLPPAFPGPSLGLPPPLLPSPFPLAPPCFPVPLLFHCFYFFPFVHLLAAPAPSPPDNRTLCFSLSHFHLFCDS